MDYKRFVLNYYKNAMQGIHIQRIDYSEEAKRPHSHAYYQMYFVLHGSLLHTTQYGEAVLSEGDAFLLPPGEMHHIREGGNMELYTFSFMPDILGEAGESNRLAVNFLHSFIASYAPCTKAELSAQDSLLARSLLDKIYEEFSEKKLGFGEVIRSYAQVLITLFARSLADWIPMRAVVDDTAERMAHCVAFIEENFSDRIEIGEMARACAMSEAYFAKAFRAYTGKSFAKFLHECRIRAALGYMEKGYKITGIYGLCGYNDFSTFYRNFKKITGCSPKSYFSSCKSK